MDKTRQTGMDAVENRLHELLEPAILLEIFTSSASDFIYAVDLASQVWVPTIVAGSFERVTGYTLEEVQEMGGWDKIIHPDDRKLITTLSSALDKGESVVIEYRVITRDEGILYLRDNHRLMEDPRTKTPTILVGGVRDVTRQRELEAELLEARRLEAVGRLVSSVAHDINNLLTAILGATELLEFTANTEALPDIVGIRDAGERAAELTHSLLNFARVEPATKNTNLNRALSDAAKFLRRSLGLEYELQVRIPTKSLVSSTSRSVLQLVLLNLVLNARDAMHGGGHIQIVLGSKNISADSELVTVHGLKPGPHAVITVRDSGMGSEEAAKERILQPFYSTRDDSTGLGLQTSQELIVRSHGALTFKSDKGKTVFYVHLPLSEGVPRPSSVRLDTGGREHLLLVDDAPEVLQVLSRGLRECGYTVHTAVSAENALEVLTQHKVDAVITDVRLPGESGIQLSARLHETDLDLPIFLITGQTIDMDSLPPGVRNILFKPITSRQISRYLRRAFESA